MVTGQAAAPSVLVRENGADAWSVCVSVCGGLRSQPRSCMWHFSRKTLCPGVTVCEPALTVCHCCDAGASVVMHFARQ